MATLILTTVGTLVGGPIGGAIGALAGQALDAQIFKPRGRQGPRLSDLRVQTSTYGTQIPKVFGTMRVAGSVIWATDLMESSQATGGGKGRPSVTSYSYSASFAVALSSRPVVGVARIWADGNLLRGAGGDFKTGIGAFRLHKGDPDQAPDPLIQGDKGVGATPACRGIAYAVFEGLQLADYGNRIPSLTFELIADEGAVGVGALAAALSGDDAITYAGEDEPMVQGYAAAGDSGGEALSPLIEAHGLLIGDGLSLTAGVERGAVLSLGDDLRRGNSRAILAREEERQPVESVPRRLSVRHYDAARDYQAGIQSAERQGVGREEAVIDLPAVIDAGAARGLAGEALRRRFVGRRRMSVARGWAALAHRPGDLIALEGQGGRWRVEALEWDAMAVQLSLRAVPSSGAGAAAPPADPGQPVRQADQVIGSTQLLLIETPSLTDTPSATPQLFVAACGENRAWRPAQLFLKDDAGAYEPIGFAARSVLGVTLSALPAGPAALIDERSFVEVELHDADAALVPATDAALLGGANGCMIGGELLQFGAVAEIGARRYRLSRLLRGRRGTEQAIAGHGVGEPFVLLREEALFALVGSHVAAGRRVEVAAQGVGDAVPVAASRTATGHAMLPLSPVQLRADPMADGGLSVRWIRRSRLGWHWADGADAPLGEEREAYLVEILAGGDLLRSRTVEAPAWIYAPAELAADGAASGGGPLDLRVRQQGTHGLGATALLRLVL